MRQKPPPRTAVAEKQPTDDAARRLAANAESRKLAIKAIKRCMAKKRRAECR